ncbi:MAG: replication protein RepA, partial [bacterium]
NGHFTLQVTGHPEFGLPFGQDRLVPIFLATMAVRQQSRIVRFESAAELLDTFGLSKGGKEYRRLVSAFERIFGATIFFGTESSRPAAKVVHRSRFNFLSEAQIWYNHDSAQPPLSDEFANVIVLSEEFYREISQHAIPADLEAVKLLASAPAVLDLFVWLTYRCFSAKGPERIPLFGSYGLAQQLGCVEYSRQRRFRAMLDHWLVSIRNLWPNCPAAIASGGQYLSINHAIALNPQSLFIGRT